MGAKGSKKSDNPPQQQLSATKRACQNEDEHVRMISAAYRELENETASLSAQRKKQEEALLATHKKIQEETAKLRKLQEEAANAAMQRKLQEEAYITGQRKLQEEAAKVAMQRKLQEEAYITGQRKLQEEAAKVAMQRKLQEEAFITGQRKLEQEAAKKKLMEEAAQKELLEEAAKKKLEEEIANKKNEEAIAAKKKLQEEIAAKKMYLEEIAERKRQEDDAKRTLQEEAVIRNLKEVALKMKFKKEIADKKKILEDAFQKKLEEDAARRELQEQVFKKKLEKEAAEKKLQEEAAKKRLEEEAAMKIHEQPTWRTQDLPRKPARYCHTCYKQSTQHFFKCYKGHSSCSNCRDSLRNCGICNGTITCYRSYNTKHDLSPHESVPCPHRFNGCKLNIKLSKMETHVKKCPFQEHGCPVGSVFGNCKWKGELLDLSRHFEDVHPNFFTSEVGPEIRISNIHRNRRYIKLIENGHHFVFHMKISEVNRKIFMTVQLIGSKHSTMKCLYEIHVYNKSDTSRKYVYEDNCCSTIDNIEHVFFKGKCAVLPVEYASTFVNNGTLSLKCFITILF